MLMGGGVLQPATREKHLIRSLSRHALLLPAPVILDLDLSLPCLQSHIPPDPRLSVFPSVADKTSLPFPF